ncbi:MAG: toast rack family protein [Acidobacteriaceae bacterium]
MNRKMILLPVIALALVTLACSININLPAQVKTGPTQTENIHVPYLADQQAIADVTLTFGAGKLTLQPGAENELISGSANYNVADFKPDITIDSNNIDIVQGNLKITGIPYINQDIINEWELSLGSRPMSLMIKAGAYTGNYELGGLSIHRLEVGDGASSVNMSFSKPNQVEMVSLDYTTGASTVILKGLANANATEMTFRSGAGNYTLDFSGQLKRDMTVNVESGVSSVTIVVPNGVSTNLANKSSLVTVTTSGGWEQHGNSYQISGTGYSLTLNVKMGAGTLQLETVSSSK